MIKGDNVLNTIKLNQINILEDQKVGSKERMDSSEDYLKGVWESKVSDVDKLVDSYKAKRSEKEYSLKPSYKFQASENDKQPLL